jgi:hypothetical protein
MLRSFFSLGAESQDFSEFRIGQETEFMEEHCGKYPVVMMDMKGIVSNSWEQMLNGLWLMLKFVMGNQDAYLDDGDDDIIGINFRDTKAKPDEAIARFFLLNLTYC